MTFDDAIKRYGTKHQELIWATHISLEGQMRLDKFTEVLDALIPGPKMPTIIQADGTKVEAYGFTVHGAGVKGRVVMVDEYEVSQEPLSSGIIDIRIWRRSSKTS